MRGGTQSASGVRHVCRRVNVRDLHCSAENQQQSAAKSKDDPPGVSRVLFCLRTRHHFNYNRRFSAEAGERLVCDQNSYFRPEPWGPPLPIFPGI